MNSTPEHDENTLPGHTEDALDSIDATVFSGDAFLDPAAAARLRWYMDRWTRQLDEMAEAVRQHDAERDQ